ncbi:MAG: hypothetical protein GEV09_28465, partial [Pseudonocardiaceae bacterium]|nr:hypothetical protein [Pseudonocardiaceae bacterium]
MQTAYRRAMEGLYLLCVAVAGSALVLLTLEAARRTVGWVVPIICVAFIAYGFIGPYVPAPFDSNNYSFGRII